MNKVLAIDYGLARVGLAVSYGSLAEPLLILANDPELLPRLREICQQHQVDTIVVGISENTMAQQSRAFAEQVRQTTGLPVVYEDETLSSIEVNQRLRDTRVGKRQHRRPIDHLAAALILERYLEQL